ncbi:MAG: protein kinase UbiB [Gemmatimonadaceae bacterium]|nr:protein kinase UbiB [Gemmatimonadaceae bacterium]
MRAFVILWRLGPIVASFMRDYRRWILIGGPVARSAEFHERRAARLVTRIAGLGPSFIKMAQLFATRADLLPEQYVAALSTLTDQVPPVSRAAVHEQIQKAYGRTVGTLFERFDEAPIAAASLGQVHFARWNGQDVAVKVLRPGVEALVRKDMAVAGPVLRWLYRRFPNAHLRNAINVVEEFSQRVWEEMDFEHEAANAVEVRANFRGNPRIAIPRIVPELVRRRVLVMEYMEGIRVDRIAPIAGDAPGNPRGVVSSVMELYLQMMMVDGLFHADPHPGNILVAADGRIVLLDFGMVVRVPRELRRNLVRTVFAAIRKDVPATVAGFRSLGVIAPETTDGEIMGLAERLFEIAYTDRTMRERIELLANEVVATMYDWPVQLPSEMVYFARTAALIEGLGVKYDPYFNPIGFASPIAIRMRSRIMQSLAEPGEAHPVDWPTMVGAAAGHVAGMIVHAGRQFLSALAAELNEPGGFSMSRLVGTIAGTSGTDRGRAVEMATSRRPGAGEDERRAVPMLLAGD